MATAVEPLLHKVVFIGGGAVDFLVNDPAAFGTRITKDVDVITEISTIAEYYSLIDELRQLGFKEYIPMDDEKSPICRLKYSDMILDVMPTDESILGFANKWSQSALENAKSIDIGENLRINIITPAYFIATKLEAFRRRGNSDYFCHDMEDIITVYNGNTDIVAEIQNSAPDVKTFIQSEFKALLADRRYEIDGIAGHLAGIGDPGRAKLVHKRILDSIA